MNITADQIGTYLTKHNIKPSYPRLRVMDYLVTMRTHPTVDEIHHALAREMPTLSKTTVYNTLNLFINANIARVVTIEDNETRYDADISDHGHFKCEACGAIYDFRMDSESLETEGLEHFRITQKHVYYKGICSKCLKNNENENKIQGGLS